MYILNLHTLKTKRFVYMGRNVRIKGHMLKERDVVIKGITNYRILKIYISLNSSLVYHYIFPMYILFEL